jgi:two-component system, sensor histidine kinase PdtaS
VTDSGAGLPPGFDLENTTSLGLQIVRTLVEGELGGQISLRPRAGGGTIAVVDLPVRYEPEAMRLPFIVRGATAPRLRKT